MKNKNLSKIRIKLDKLDEALLKLFKKRTNLVDQVLKLKKFKKEIVDKKRIKNILKRIKMRSKQKGIDPKITVNIWDTIIKSYIKYEYRNFKK
ncbi:MAG: chorismate mutase/chorismate mutase / prephenate dehydrogenase [Pelagibacterales bacterium]|jgi:chorismate mutase|nr:chorismate mutase/chorismate mutase / prephenate dehydrogenase [Pelagibacterales bacterium]